MILITTSRRPTRRIRTFCNDLARCIPDAVRVNRGKLSREGLAEKALEVEADRVIIVDRWKGGPGKIELYRLAEDLLGVPPLIYIRGIKLQREFALPKIRPPSSLAIICECPSEGKDVRKLAEALSDFLKVPFLTDDISKKNYEVCMRISEDALREMRITFIKPRENREIGPRITVSHLIWELKKT